MPTVVKSTPKRKTESRDGFESIASIMRRMRRASEEQIAHPFDRSLSLALDFFLAAESADGRELL